MLLFSVVNPALRSSGRNIFRRVDSTGFCQFVGIFSSMRADETTLSLRASRTAYKGKFIRLTFDRWWDKTDIQCYCEMFVPLKICAIILVNFSLQIECLHLMFMFYYLYLCMLINKYIQSILILFILVLYEGKIKKRSKILIDKREYL